MKDMGLWNEADWIAAIAVASRGLAATIRPRNRSADSRCPNSSDSAAMRRQTQVSKGDTVSLPRGTG